MIFKKDTSYLMLKFNTPLEIDFLQEHKTILEKSGKFGLSFWKEQCDSIKYHPIWEFYFFKSLC